MTIIGVGRDTPAANLRWAEDEGFEYELWTDDDGTLGVTYGALENARDTSVNRVTMLLDADGELLLQYTDSINVGTHPGLVLEDCEKIFAE